MSYNSFIPFENVKLPYITVSAKGMSNGLSDEPNDGMDFGPDTMLGATSPDQYGPPYTQTSGIQEAHNYVRSFATNSSAYLPEIHLAPGTYLVHYPIYLKYTSTALPPEVINSTTNSAAVTAPVLIGLGNVNGNFNYTPTGVIIQAASDFPANEYLYALLLPSTPWETISGDTSAPWWVGGKIENIIFDCNKRAAGISLSQFGNANVRRLSIKHSRPPIPVITAAPDSYGQSFQTGAFVFATTIDTGNFTELADIQIRSDDMEDGFVLSNNSGILTGINLWTTYTARYGFNIGGGMHPNHPRYPLTLINPESDMGSGVWTGSVPSTSPPSPQQAGYYIQSGAVVRIINNNVFAGAVSNNPYIFNLGTVYIDGGYYSATGNQYVIEGTGLTVVDGAGIEYNSSNNGVFNSLATGNEPNILWTFKNITYFDNNTGTPSIRPYNINWGSNPSWQTHIYVDAFFDNIGRYFGGFPPSLSANPPASGTVYQNQNPTKIRIILPVYATTSGTAGSVAVAMGNNSTGTNPPTIPTLFTKYINGSTSSSATELITLEVPAGWYYSFTGTGVTFGTATVEPI